MKKLQPVLKFQIFSVILVSILGTLLHFTYQWSNYNSFIGLFSAVNESTWENLKLVFFPMFLTIIIGFFYFEKYIPNFLCAKTLGIIISICFIIVFFYTYTGMLGANFATINILSFYIAIILGEYISYKLMISNFKCNKKIAIITLAILLLSFVIFTYIPPEIGLFKNPISNSCCKPCLFVLKSRVYNS